MGKGKHIAGEQSYLRKRSRSNFIVAMFSMAFVLFILGFFAVAALFSQSFFEHVLTDYKMKVFLHDGISEVQMNRFMTQLRAKPYAQTITYTSKEEASDDFFDQKDESMIEIMEGVNPLLASMNISLKPEYITAGSITPIRKELSSELIVAKVEYPIESITKMGSNVRLLAIIAIALILAVTIIALYLIFNTIKLSIYAQRLNIRSMQLIGATNAFVRKPFVSRGLGQGFLAGIIACGLLFVAVLFIDYIIDSTRLVENEIFRSGFFIILVSLVIFGACLGWIGSRVAVNHYLNKNLDELMS